MSKALGKAYRKGLSLIQAARKFTTEEKAECWFISKRRPDGVRCAWCDSERVSERKNRYPSLHETVKHSVAEFVRGQAHTNGVESFWATLKRGYVGIYHHMSAKHLHRYVAEFSGRHNQRPLDTDGQMARMVIGAVGKRLMYSKLIGSKHRTQLMMI